MKARAETVSMRSTDTRRRVSVNAVAARTAPAGEVTYDWRRENIGRLLLFAFAAFESRMIAGYRAAGFDDVRQVHLNALRHVDVRTGTRIVDLAARAGVTKGAMGPMLEECARLDLVVIKPDPTDNRAKLVQLSKRGAKFMFATERTVAKIERDFKKLLGAAAYEQLVSSLRLLNDRIEASSPNCT